MNKFLLIVSSINLFYFTVDAQVSSFGLEGKVVTSLRLLDDVLYVGTKGDGVFLRALTDTGWTSLGLEGKWIRSIYPYTVDASSFSLLAGTYGPFDDGDSTVIYGLSTNGWVAADSGIDHRLTYVISSINGILTPSGDYIVYATGDGPVYKRSNYFWNNVFFDNWGITVDISPSGAIWTGGYTGFWFPFIATSTDQSNTWRSILFNTDTLGGPISSFAFHPADSDVIYASGGYFILKTTNGGSDWNVVNAPDLAYHRLVIDPIVPSHLFDGGYYPEDSTNRGRLFETFDGGIAWQEITLSESARGILDLEIGITDSLDLYIATNGSGVYRLRQYAPAFPLKVTSGWNMISLPRRVSDYRKSVLFPPSTSSAFTYERGYRQADTLNNGKGYWIKFSVPEVVNIFGEPLYTDTVEVNVGWNMIGSISKPVQSFAITSDPPGILTSQFYYYQGMYVESDFITPGKAYWVKVSQSGKFILSQVGNGNAQNKIRIIPTLEQPPPPPTRDDMIVQKMPTQFSLDQNYPNPFNPLTIINYQLPIDSWVTLKVYNMLGQEVATLVDEVKEPGEYTVSWDARQNTDGLASNVPSGIYFVRMTAKELTFIRKVILLR